MPPPVLVNADGTPYPSSYQLLVPGRDNHNNSDIRRIIDAMAITDETGRNRVNNNRGRNRGGGQSGRNEINIRPAVVNQLSTNDIHQNQSDDDSRIDANITTDGQYGTPIENEATSNVNYVTDNNDDELPNQSSSSQLRRNMILCDVKPAEARYEFHIIGCINIAKIP